jgi:EmrB/QacA subfamily drug resistance transporter
MSIGELTHKDADLSAKPRPGLLLAVCCVAQFMVILDLSIVNVALPSIQVSLKFSSADLQWVVDAYAIVFAGFLMLAGRAADMFGQRRMFGAGLLLFSLASLLGGAAQSSGMLIIARAVQGLGGALMAASSLAIITSSFAAGPERHRAIALWGAMNGLGGAAGVLFGGIITEAISWRCVLLINVPLGIAAAAVAYRVVARRSPQHGQGFDALGALILTGGLLVLAYGGVTAGNDGWGSASALIPLAVGSVVLALFPLAEKRAAAPLVPAGALTRQLKVVNLIVVLFSASIFPMWYIGSLYLQQVLALSPIQTGLTFLPMALGIFACASQAGKLVSRAGVRVVLGGGLVLMAAGMALLARINYSGHSAQLVILPGMLVAIGIGFSIVPSTIAATVSAGQAQAGFASGLVNTARQVGGGLGLAILISIATQDTSHLIGEGHPVLQSLTDGFRVGYLIGAGLCVLAALLTFTMLRAPAPAPAAAPIPAPGRRRAGQLVLAATAAIVAVFAIVDFAIPRTLGAPIGAYTTRGTYSFVSAPDLHPPKIRAQIPAPAGGLGGFIMTTNFYDLARPPIAGQSGPLMLDSRLQPVWFEPVPANVVAGNLKAQTYDGRPVLSWWQGDITPTGETNSGEDIVVNDHYQTIARLKATGGWVVTLHEFLIRGHDAWVTANRNVQANLSSYGGVNHGVLVESAVQEYDLRTGKLVYSWNASGHLPLTDSETQPPSNGFGWDAYHINSISLVPGDRMLVSFRNTWSAVMVDRKTGRVLWTLGGKHSTFSVPAGAGFQWQHDVQYHPGGEISVFDDHCCEITGNGQYLDPDGPSRALVFKLDPATRSATVVKRFANNQGFDAEYMGNVQLLSDGGAFIGWGDAPFISEYSPSGRVIFQAVLPSPDLTYRAYLQNWVGLPVTRPSGAARLREGHVIIYVSWNGATRVHRWRVLAVPSAGAPRAIAQAVRTGFETAIPAPTSAGRYEVQALDSAGRPIGTSRPFAATG